MRALVTGGDGYRGWPKVLYLSVQGCELSVAIEREARRCEAANTRLMHLGSETHLLGEERVGGCSSW